MNYTDRVDGCYSIIYTNDKKGIVGKINNNEAITYIVVKSTDYIETLRFSLDNVKGNCILATFENITSNIYHYSSVFLSSVPLIKSSILINDYEKIGSSILQISIGIINI
jgi:hypothetical protein